MDIRNWLNGPKGLKTKPKPAEIKKKKHALDSSDEDEIDEKKVKITKPKPKLKQSDVGIDLNLIGRVSANGTPSGEIGFLPIVKRSSFYPSRTLC